MLYTSTDLFTLTEDSQLTNKLDLQLANINLKMSQLKKEWANNYMLANETSKQAFIHRFVKRSTQSGRVSGDGQIDNQDCLTAEEAGIKYKNTYLVRKVVNTLFREYTTREFNCQVKSIPNDDWKLVVKFLIDQSFNSLQFANSHRYAILDAVVKGTGYLRPRLYDLTVEAKVPKINKTGKKKIDFKTVKKTIKQGLEIEYVDCENVYMDPFAKDPKECFIVSHYTDLELCALFPQTKSKINFDNEVMEDNKDIFLRPEYIGNYRIGERLVELYNYPDQKISSVDEYGNTSESSMQSYFDVNSISDFNNNWDTDIMGGAGFDNFYSCQDQKYLVKEYYNWADLSNPRYVLYINNYVLYDGPILEPFFGCPVVPLYFQRNKESIFGQGVPTLLNNVAVDLNEASTDLAELIKIAKSTILEVNTDRLEDSNSPIDVEPNGLTYIKTKSLSQDGSVSNAPVVLPVQIPIVGLELTVQQEQKYRADIESIMPNSEPLSANMSKEEREQSLRSRMLTVNEVLNINKAQLSLLAYMVFNVKMFELQYFGEPMGIKTDVSTRVLVVKDTGEDLLNTKKQITESLANQYEMQVQMKIQQLSQDPEFIKQLEQVKAELKDKYSSLADNAAAQTDSSTDKTAIVETSKEEYVKELQAFVQETAKKDIPQPEDNSIYLAMEDIDDIISVQKEFEFSFAKSREEQQYAINQLLSFVGALPLSGQAINYDSIIAEALIAYGMNPLIKLVDVPPTNQMMAKTQTRHTTFIDFANMPTALDKIMAQNYGIALPDGTALKDLQLVQQIKTAAETAKEQAKIEAQGKTDVNKVGLQAQLQQLVQPKG